MRICGEKTFWMVRDGYEKKYITLQVVVVNLPEKVGIRLATENIKDSTINF